jgi:HEAT repeat protein
MLNEKSWLDLIRAGAMNGLYHMNNDIKEVIKFAKPGEQKRTRMLAIAMLGKFGKGDREVLETLLELAEDRHTLIQMAAVQALEQMADERAIPVLEKLSKGKRDGRLIRDAEEAIKAMYPWLETDLESYRATKEMQAKKEKENKA